MPLGFGMLMYEGDPEVVDAAIATMPKPVRPVIRELAAQAFAEHARHKSRLTAGNPTLSIDPRGCRVNRSRAPPRMSA